MYFRVKRGAGSVESTCLRRNLRAEVPRWAAGLLRSQGQAIRQSPHMVFQTQPLATEVDLGKEAASGVTDRR